MKVSIATALLLATMSLVACVDGGDDCSGTPLTPTRETASERATSCAETVSVEGLTYVLSCDQVRDSLLGRNVARGQSYVARSIADVPVGSALAIGGLDDQGRLDEDARCGGWRYAPVAEIGPQRNEEIERRVLEPEDQPDH